MGRPGERSVPELESSESHSSAYGKSFFLTVVHHKIFLWSYDFDYLISSENQISFKSLYVSFLLFSSIHGNLKSCNQLIKVVVKPAKDVYKQFTGRRLQWIKTANWKNSPLSAKWTWEKRTKKHRWSISVYLVYKESSF